jgi:hypothetical protein
VPSPNLLAPPCDKCKSETEFRQIVLCARDSAQVHLYQCVRCRHIHFYAMVNDQLRVWP